MEPESQKPLRRDDLVATILGSRTEFDAEEIARLAGVDLDTTRRIWRALGFPEYDEGEVAFTRGDMEALKLLNGSIADDVIDFDTALNLTRAMGTTMSRLADWQIAALAPRLPSDGGSQGRILAAKKMVDAVGGPFESLMIYAWRRHLAAAAARIEALGDDEDLSTSEVTVGFIDIVAFSALSNEIGEERVGDLVEVFESRCHDVVSAHGGRVIKSLGDSVLFVSDDPIKALDIANGLISVIGRDSRMPDVRLGLASGGVVMRMGDVFGPPVNLAARLTAVARRNRVIIDDATAALLPEEQFATRRLPARPLRGFGLVEPINVRPR